MILTFEKPYFYIDSFGDKYKFYISTANNGTKHFNISVEFKNSKDTISIFGYEVQRYYFSYPLGNETILWNAYDNMSNPPIIQCMSEEARKMANKIFKLKVFL